MKKILLTISILCCFQSFPSYGMEALTPDNNPAKLDIQEKEATNDTLANLPKKDSYELKITTSSPKKQRKRLTPRTIRPIQKPTPKPTLKLELHLLSVPGDLGLASPGAIAGSSLSSPATPAPSPKGTPRCDSPKSKNIQSSGESMSLSSTTVSNSQNSNDSMSLASSTDSLPNSSDDELAYNIVTNPKNPIRHLGVIPDGNRRWAELKGVSNDKAYAKSALKTIPQITKDAFNLGVKALTIWVFSTENWSRGKEDADSLMRHFDMLIDEILPIAHDLKFKIVHMGKKDRLPEFLKIKIAQAEHETAQHSLLTYNLAIDYGGQDDVVRAIQNIARGKPGEEPFDFANIDAATITKNMDTGGQQYPNPDLVIRTTIGDYKTSGFMLWGSSRFKLFFPECYAPDLNKGHLIQAIFSFADRERMFGK